jgi:hypothetical protein
VITWTAHPARRRPQQIALVAAVVLLSAWAVMVTLDSAYLALLAAVLLVLAVAPFWLPTHYRLDDDGVEERRWPRRRFRAWRELRRIEIGPGAALVSPFARRHALDRMRGLIVYFDGGPRDRIVAALQAGVGSSGEAP